MASDANESAMASLRIRTFLSLVFLSFWSLRSHAAESITNTQPLTTWETILSPNRIFVLGFFTSKRTTSTFNSFYLGIWISNDNDLESIWVAYRNYAILSPTLKISESGNLIISSDSGDILVTNVTGASRNTSAKLLDNGNLVLLEGANGHVLWQSFDHPTDTLLPGMKLRFLTSWLTEYDPYPGAFTLGINPNGTNQFVIWYRGVVYWTSRVWNSSGHDDYDYSFETDEHGKYFIYTVNQTARDDNLIYNWWITPSGQFRRQKWNASSSNGVSSDVVQPNIPCDGTFEGDGCRRRAWPNCSDKNENGFLKVQATNNFKFNTYDNNSSIALSDCEFTCRSSCTCIAYTTFSDAETGCLFKYANGREIPGLSYTGGFFIRDNSKNLHEKPGRKRWRLWVIILLPVSFIIILLVFIPCHVQRKGLHRDEKIARRELSVLELDTNGNDGAKFSDTGKKGLDLPIFSFYTVLAATNNFSAANKLGEGGFGPVYQGKLPNDQEVAMKRLSRSSRQGPEEFKNEILLISKLQHKNLVKLIGICLHADEKILVYEYMPNKSLDFFLFDPTKREILDWEKRVHIIDGIAQGLLYLHKYSRLTVIHRDLKASNILLDGDMNPKISDFGMARIFSGNDSNANTNRVVGTYGYMSPEYAMEGLFSVKSDVFSFGVLLLEIMTSKKNTSFQHFDRSLNLLGYAWELWNEGRGLELIDPILVNSSPATELMRYIHVALLCIQERATDRPKMSEVILLLSNQNAAMLSPIQPAFFFGRNAATTSSSDGPRPCSVNDVTISTMDGR